MSEPLRLLGTGHDGDSYDLPAVAPRNPSWRARDERDDAITEAVRCIERVRARVLIGHADAIAGARIAGFAIGCGVSLVVYCVVVLAFSL
jgi:hypothetical protein